MRVFSVPEIVAALGEAKGSRFTAGGIVTVIQKARARGDWGRFPLRRGLSDDGEPDEGIDAKTAKALGL